MHLELEIYSSVKRIGRNRMFQQHGVVIKPSRNDDIQICVKNETSNEKTDVTRDAYIFSVFAIMMRNS